VVDAQRSPDCTTSPLMPTHMEQPDVAHSKPCLTEDTVEAFFLCLTL
jgi:hypothetical protein